MSQEGVSRSVKVLDSAWNEADKHTSLYKDWVEQELDDDRLGQEVNTHISCM